MTNPRRRRHARAVNPHRSHRRRSANPTRRRRRNPTFIRVRNRHHSRRRNPDLHSALMVGLGAAAGNVATRGLTQAFLGQNNSGYVGVAANLGVAYVLSFAAEKLRVDREVSLGVLAGGVAGAAQRLYEMLVAPAATSALSGLGDPWYSSNGLGEYRQYSTFPPNAFPPALPSTSAAAATPGVV